MASVFTHAFFALGKLYAAASEMPARFWLLSALCAVLPDADVAAFVFGVAYGDVLGHRGLTHSLAFALLADCGAGGWETVTERPAPLARPAKRRARRVHYFVYSPPPAVINWPRTRHG